MEKINWKDLLFPILNDIQEINRETDINIVAKNNLDLANNDTQYLSIIRKINENKSLNTSTENKFSTP